MVILKFANVFSHRAQAPFWQLLASLRKSFSLCKERDSNQERVRVNSPALEHTMPRGADCGWGRLRKAWSCTLHITQKTTAIAFGPTKFNH